VNSELLSWFLADDGECQHLILGQEPATPPTLTCGSHTGSQIGLECKPIGRVVTSSSWTTPYAKLQTWEARSHGAWIKPFGEMSARIGRNGFNSRHISEAELRHDPGSELPDPENVRPVEQSRHKDAVSNADSNDYWVCDPREPKTYNVLQPYQSPTRTGALLRLNVSPLIPRSTNTPRSSPTTCPQTCTGTRRQGAPHDNSGRCDQGRRDLPPCQRTWGYGRVCVLGRVFDAEGVEVVGPCQAASHDHGPKQHRSEL
jgi:hypothetical protein